jgi:hypothetical protein
VNVVMNLRVSYNAAKQSSDFTTGGLSSSAQPHKVKTKTKLHGLSPQANYIDRATAACRRSDCQLLRIEGATWSA